MKVHTWALAFILTLVITGLCASSIVFAQNGRTVQILAAGDSAERARVTLQVIREVCATGAITWTQRGPAHTQLRCPLAEAVRDEQQRRYTHLDFRFDTVGAAASAVSANCDHSGWVSIAGKAVLMRSTCQPPAQTAGRAARHPGSTLNTGPQVADWPHGLTVSAATPPR